MISALENFEKLLHSHLIPDFCSDATRGLDPSSFIENPRKISEFDACHFLRAWQGGLIEHKGRGLYRGVRSAASEQFFWSGRRDVEKRSFTLWLEPVITIAALGRLHYDLQWPEHLIGTQSSDWAFDIVAFLPDSESEFIAGEIKKTPKEIDDLIDLMTVYGQDPNAPIPSSGKARNAYKKVAALRVRQASLFWAIGPNGISRVYQPEYAEDSSIFFHCCPEDTLRFPHHSVSGIFLPRM